MTKVIPTRDRNEVRGARCEVRGARCEVRGASMSLSFFALYD